MSEAPKLCIDCKWFKSDVTLFFFSQARRRFGKCHHPASVARRNVAMIERNRQELLIDGKARWLDEELNHEYASVERGDYGDDHCGLSGNFWEAK